MKETVLSQIIQLEKMSINQLQDKYKELFNTELGIQNNKKYLVRRIAYKIQENAYGGLSEKSKTKLNNLISEHDPINNIQPRPKPCKRYKRDVRLPLAGSIITKEYKGNLIEVKILERGFEYNGRMFRSLTAVVREITGTHWNPFVFFNL